MSDVKTLTLTDFLLARIAEDEAVARAAGFWGTLDLSEWEHAVVHQAGRIQSVAVHGTEGYEDHVAITHDYEGLSDSVSEEAGPHIARHDPARVLAECNAKRRIVEREHVECAGHPGPYQPHGDYGIGYCGRADEENDNLLALAAVYADHPDYRDDWA